MPDDIMIQYPLTAKLDEIEAKIDKLHEKMDVVHAATDKLKVRVNFVYVALSAYGGIITIILMHMLNMA